MMLRLFFQPVCYAFHRRVLSRSIRVAVASASIAAAALLLTGCSEMKFAKASSQATSEANDPRKEMTLTHVTTDMTSGPLLRRRVASDRAVYSPGLGVLMLDTVQVDNYAPDGKRVEGITKAERAALYMQDSAAENPDDARSKRDMDFIGNVRYRAPKANDPTSFTTMINAGALFWREKQNAFVCREPFEMKSFPQKGNVLKQQGKGFVASRDLLDWQVGGGLMTTDLKADARALASAKLKELETDLAELQQKTKSVPKPETVHIPEEYQKALPPGATQQQ